MFVHFLALIDIAEAITQAFRTFFGMLCIPIYNLIEIFYELFSYIARAEVLSNGMVEEIYRKVGLILGIFMTFKLIFSLIQALIDPTKLNDKKNGYTSIIFRCLISIVLLGVTPAIFDMAFDLQNAIIGNSENTSNIIYRLIVEDNSNINSDNFGRKLATELYFSFYKQTEGAKWEPGTYLTNNGLVVDTYDNLKRLTEEGKITYSELAAKLYEDDNSGKYMIEFDGLLCLVVGVFTAYLLLMFCIQTSIRVFQLAYLQLIAPIPIISYISDPEGSFKKWYSQCLSTYLDLFIRLAIVYFIVYLSNYIIAEFNSENISFDTGNSLFNVAVEIFLILGLLLFAKKVPDLIKDLFPNLGGGAGKFSFGLNLKKEAFEPLKQLYNTTPLGWAPKALGWTGKKTIAAYERHKYNLPKPRSKFGQAVDKLMPGRAEVLKNRNEIKKRKDLYEEGREISKTYNGDIKDANGNLKSGVFNNKKFIESWQKVADAKKEQGEAERYFEEIRSKVARGKLSTDSDEYKNAEKWARAAAAKVDAAKMDHENNRKIYTKDARREDAFKYYSDMNPKNRRNSGGGPGGNPGGGSGGNPGGGSGGNPGRGSGGNPSGGSGGNPSGGSGGNPGGGSGGNPGGGSGGNPGRGSGGNPGGGSGGNPSGGSGGNPGENSGGNPSGGSGGNPSGGSGGNPGGNSGGNPSGGSGGNPSGGSGGNPGGNSGSGSGENGPIHGGNDPVNETQARAILGLPVVGEITKSDIMKAYRKMTKIHHPDRNPNNPYADRNMQIINSAFSMLTSIYGRH